MLVLLVPFIVVCLTGCGNYDSCCEKSCETVCAVEEAAPVVAPVMTEKEMKGKLEAIASQFGEMMKEKFSLTSQLTTTPMPVNGVTTMLSTDAAMDIGAARKMILESAEALLKIANENEVVKENAKSYPLTVNDLDILIDSSSGDSTIRSVSLIRGVIEYEAYDQEAKSYKIVKQEPVSHAQAKSEGKGSGCCGSFFVES